MKQLIWLIAFTLLIVPAYAQDDGDFGGGGGFGDFGGFGFEGDNGGDPFAGEDFGAPTAAPKVDPLVDLRAWLTRASAPSLDKKQEKALKKLYDKEVKAIAKSFEKQYGISLESALAAQNAPRGRRGFRGQQQRPETPTVIRRLSDQLMDKIIAALRLDQQGALRTYQSEQLREQRQQQFVLSMELAGLPLTPEQAVEVDALYARESRLRTLIIVEARGEPSSQNQVRNLEAQTTQRVMALMNSTQKTAIAEVRAKSKTGPVTPRVEELESLP